MIDRLFARLHAFYGAKFVEQWKGVQPDDMRKVWAEELAGFSIAELGNGVHACRSRTWPPTLPEFMTLCRPPIEPAQAWYAAQLGAQRRDRGEVGFVSPVLFEAYRRMSAEVRSGEPHTKHLERWRATLADVEREIAAGLVVELTEPPKELPAPQPATREEASAALAAIRRRFGLTSLTRNT